MSTIWGVIRFDGLAASEVELDRMGTALAHRAPDGRSSRVVDAVGFGYGSLQVTREDAFEVQPVYDPADEIMLVADARLDNREVLARTLGIADTALEKLPDSALLIAAYRRWDVKMARHLLGDFAFAIWDGRKRRLVLARDHMGQRYVHYHRGDGFLAFATEAKGLHALASVPRALDEAAVMRSLLLDFHVQDSGTHFVGISGIPGGSTLIVEEDGSQRLERYWRPHAAPEHVGRDTAYYVATYRRLIEEAVACRVRRLIDPPGLLLSGGFDSAAIAGLTGPHLRGGQRLLTATSALAPGVGHPLHHHDARQGAEWCVDHMPHLDHRFFERRGEGILDDPDRIHHVQDGVPTGADYIFHALNGSLRSRGARLVMDGIGGDCTLNSRALRHLPNLLAAGRYRAFLSALMQERRVTGQSIWYLLRRQVWPHIPLGRWVRCRRGAKQPPPWLHDYANPVLQTRLHWARDLSPPDVIPLRDRAPEAASQQDILEICQNRARPNGANEAAAAGLDLTRPMHDPRIVEFGLAIPEHLQNVKGRIRWLAIMALGEVLPPAFATRARSQEHLDPDYGGMIRAAVPAMRETVGRMRERTGLCALFDMDRLQRDLAPERVARMSDRELTLLGRAYLTARYVGWFNRDNI